MDFNLDGKADILWRNKATGEDVIWLMNGTSFSLPVFLTNILPGSPWVMAGIGDFDNDGKNDILWSYQKPGEHNDGLTAFWKMNGTSWTLQSSSFFLNTNLHIRGAADFNRDGYCDLIWEDISTGVKAVQYMGTNFQTFCSNSFGDIYHLTNWQMSATADLNGDHIPDIVLRDPTVGRVALWFMQYDSTNGLQVNSTNLLWDTTKFPLGFFIQADQDWKIVGAGNFQSWTNGNVDLLVRHATLGFNALWTINGTNFLGGLFLADSVQDTNWRIATQDVADSKWALQGDHRPRLTATSSMSPLGITLTYTNFQSIPNGLTMTVQRKLTMETNWTTIASNLGPPFSYADTNVSIGTNYDYQVFYQAFGISFEKTAIASGINVPPVENRGKIILLVDKALATQFPAQMNGALSELTSDLVGDGWTIIQTNVARHDDVTWSNNTNNIVFIRSYVSNTFILDMVNTKGVFIIGHVPIPYSGTKGPDGHTSSNSPPDHQGAWPADGVYGDIDGVWTDANSHSNLAFQANFNAVGDGKFDQNDFPSSLELFVGRVDFANLPLFGTALSPTAAEANLVKQYFDKAHKFRFGLPPYPLRLGAAAYGYFNANPQSGLNNGTFENALRNASAFFGPALSNIVVADSYLQGANANPRSYLWGFDAGFGNSDAMNRSTGIPHTSADLTNPSLEPSIGFYVLDGSYFGDWNMTNNFMRATLATANYGLIALWLEGTRTAHWRLHGMALGEPIGFALLRTVNNLDRAANDKDRTLAILGDPTLRLHTLTAPAGFIGHPGAGCVNFSWNAVPGVQYNLYKGPSANGPFTVLSTNPVQFSTTDCPFPGSHYMLRGLQLVTSGTGSYTNISQGSFWH